LKKKAIDGIIGSSSNIRFPGRPLGEVQDGRAGVPGEWYSTDQIADLARKYERYVTYWEPRERATMWHASVFAQADEDWDKLLSTVGPAGIG
jgi:hypothetical protein